MIRIQKFLVKERLIQRKQQLVHTTTYTHNFPDDGHDEINDNVSSTFATESPRVSLFVLL